VSFEKGEGYRNQKTDFFDARTLLKQNLLSIRYQRVSVRNVKGYIGPKTGFKVDFMIVK